MIVHAIVVSNDGEGEEGDDDSPPWAGAQRECIPRKHLGLVVEMLVVLRVRRIYSMI